MDGSQYWIKARKSESRVRKPLTFQWSIKNKKCKTFLRSDLLFPSFYSFSQCLSVSHTCLRGPRFGRVRPSSGVSSRADCIGVCVGTRWFATPRITTDITNHLGCTPLLSVSKRLSSKTLHQVRDVFPYRNPFVPSGNVAGHRRDFECYEYCSEWNWF